jgi:hypothetical protein
VNRHTEPPPHAPKPRVLVVTTHWWPSDGRLVLTLRNAGCAVSVLCPTGHPVRVLRLERIHTQRAFGHMAALSRAIRLDTPDLVVPADERAVRDLHRLHATGSDSERALIERSLGPPQTFGQMTSRLGSLLAASDAGLRIADTIKAPTPSSVMAWAPGPGGTVVLKSDGSSGGRGVRFVRADAVEAAHRELRRGAPLAALLKRWLVNRDPFGLADLLRARSPALVAQRHVAGRVGDLAMFCRDGELEGAAVAIQEQCGRLNGASTLVRIVDRPDLVAGAAMLARRLRLSGFIGIDFVIDDAGDAFVIEINPRVTPLASYAPGPNGPVLAAARALGANGAIASDASRELIAYFPDAWRIDPLDARLSSCAPDIPTDEPALLAELLRTPWPDRSALARLSAMAGRALTGRRRPGPLSWPLPRTVAAPRDPLRAAYASHTEEVAD